MKKFALLSLVLILLAASAVPVFAADGPKGHGHGVGAGQGSGGGQGSGAASDDQSEHGSANGQSHRNSNHERNGNHGNSRPGPFYLQGTISALDAGAKTITVTLTHGSARVKQFIGTDLVLQLTDGTMIFKLTQSGDEGSSTEAAPSSSGSATSDEGGPSNRVPVTFADLAVGQKVAVHGFVTESHGAVINSAPSTAAAPTSPVTLVYTARLITIYVNSLVGGPVIEKP